MKMNEELAYWQPDQIAECRPCSHELYCFLWNELVPKYDDRPRGEAPGEFIHGFKEWWQDIPAEFQTELNEIAETIEAENKAFWNN